MYFKLDRIAWAIRLLPNRFFAFEELGLPIPLLEEICAMKQGLVLVTGATGSGKTTTLASILDRINKTRAQRRANAEKALTEPNPEGTNTVMNAYEDIKWMPTTANGLRKSLQEDVEGQDKKDASGEAKNE